MKTFFGGRYTIIKKVGVGGMADVYKAEDTVLNRPVAIKVLHPQFAQEENFVARFRREAQAAANLNHPNIVSIYDWGSEDGAHFIVMEYLEGRDLKQIIQERGPLAPKVAIDVASQVCAALQFAHRHQVVHRDIKPHNIIITLEGEVKVTDFGIARAGTSTMTQTGSILGTAHYISPEQARGTVVGFSSDIYSLGVVLFEMLTGKVPFKGDNPVTVALRQVHETPPSPRSIISSIPESLEKVALKALSKHPDDRYGSAEEMRLDLERALKGLPVKAEVASSGEETVVIPTPISSAPVSGPEKSVVKARPKKKRGLMPWIILAVFLLLWLAGGLLWALTSMAPPRVAVPSIEKKTVPEARAILKKSGLKLKVTTRVFHEEVESNHIISQEPGWGERIRKGSTVSAIVSKGIELVKVPRLVGKTEAQATYLLAKYELELGTVKRVFSDAVPEDIVISQDPDSGEKVKTGITVDLEVSKGETEIRVPDVVGKTSADAAYILKKAGLKVTQSEEFNESVSQGQVIRQSPSAGTSVSKGFTVTLVISKGEEKITIPSVIGMTEDEAKTKLQEAGFEVQLQYLPSAEQVGKVVEQDPAANSEAKKGATVTISIGEEPSD